MTSPLARRTGRWVLCATTGLALAGPALDAGEGRATVRRMNNGPAVVTSGGLHAPTIQPGEPGLLLPPPNSIPISSLPEQPSPVLQTAGEQSDVTKYLEALYARDGREMPSMNLSDLPNTQYAPDYVPMPPEPGTEAASFDTAAAPEENYRPPLQAPEKPRLFGRVFGFWRNRVIRPKAPEAVQPSAAPQRLTQQTPPAPMPPAPVTNPRPAAANAENVAAAPVTSPPVPMPPAVSAPPAINPFDELPQPTQRRVPPFRKSLASQEQKPAPVEEPAPELAAKAAAEPESEFPDPFTELSEAEADQNVGPYTGLKLSEQSTETPTVASTTPSETPRSHSPATEEFQPPQVNEPAKLADSNDDLAPADSSEPNVDGKPGKLAQIQARPHRGGLKGFCPVALRDDRDLRDSRSEFTATYMGKTYQFSSAEARDKFASEPEKYAPIQAGTDVVLMVAASTHESGSIEHAAWYRDRLYLFASGESLETFKRDPSRFAQQR